MSELKVKGTITKINKTEEISGGKYNKMIFVVTNQDGYEGASKDYAFEIFEKAEGERIANFEKFNNLGQVVEVSFEIRCNENGGRYFTSLSAWKVWADKESTSAPTQSHDEVLDEEPDMGEPPF